MKDIEVHVTNVVKDSLAKACQANGIDAKSEVGFAVGGHGMMTMMVTNAGPVVEPAWTILISLRSLLLGQNALAASAPVPGILPTDAQFGAVVDRMIAELDKARHDEFNGKPANDGKIDPAQVIKVK